MIIYDILLILQYQVSTTVMDLIVVFCIVSCLYLCLPCCVSVSLPNFRWIKIYIPLSSDHWQTWWPDNTHLLMTDYFLFMYWYPRDAMLARVLAMALYLSVCLSVCVCFCLSQVGVLSKRMNESSWCLVWELPSTGPALCLKEIQFSPKTRLLTSGTLSQTQNAGLLAMLYFCFLFIYF